MEEVCKNCEYFTQMSIIPSKLLWGDCRKPANGTGQTDEEKKGVFKWGDATCSDFKPKQQAE